MVFRIDTRLPSAHEDSIWTLKWITKSAASSRILTGSVDELIKVWDPNTQQHIANLEGHTLGVLSLDTTHSGALAVSTSLDAQMRIWDLQQYKTIMTIDAGPIQAWSVTLHPSTTTPVVAAGTHAGTVNFYNFETGTRALSQELLNPKGKFTMCVAFSNREGRYLAAGHEDGKVTVWDVGSAKICQQFHAHSGPVRSICWAPDNSTLLSASDDKKVQIYDPIRGKLIASINAHAAWAVTVKFSPDELHFASGSADRKVKIWDLATRTCMHTFHDAKEQIWTMDYSADGTRLAAAGDGKDVVIYECI